MTWIISLVVLILAIPSGFLIAWMARDELKDGRFWFSVLTISSFILGSCFYLTGSYAIMNTLFFIMIVSFISYVKSKDSKWTKI